MPLNRWRITHIHLTSSKFLLDPNFDGLILFDSHHQPCWFVSVSFSQLSRLIYVVAANFECETRANMIAYPVQVKNNRLTTVFYDFSGVATFSP